MEKYNQGTPSERGLTGKMTAKMICVGKTERDRDLWMHKKKKLDNFSG